MAEIADQFSLNLDTDSGVILAVFIVQDEPGGYKPIDTVCHTGPADRFEGGLVVLLPDNLYAECGNASQKECLLLTGWLLRLVGGK